MRLRTIMQFKQFGFVLERHIVKKPSSEKWENPCLIIIAPWVSSALTVFSSLSVIILCIISVILQAFQHFPILKLCVTTESVQERFQIGSSLLLKFIPFFTFKTEPLSSVFFNYQCRVNWHQLRRTNTTFQIRLLSYSLGKENEWQ